MAEYHTKVLIIGSGSAGCSAAIYAARANQEPIMVHGTQPGGQLTITLDVENYPGFADPVQGPWLMEQMEKQAENVGTKIIHDTIMEVDFSKRPFTLKGDTGDIYTADSVILATGADAKWLGMESEQKFQGFGVSACATCDGFFYKGKDALVVGGGNTAVEEALFLSDICNKVTLIHRRDTLRAEQIMQERLFKKENVTILWDTELDEVLGTEDPLGVTGVRVFNNKTNEKTEIPLEGVFIAIGHKPNTDFLRDSGLDFDHEGYLIAEAGSTKTNIPGVFAAGDVRDKVYRQAVTAAGMGCMAALDAKHFLEQEA